VVKALLGILLLLPAAADETFTVSGTVTFDGPVPPVKTNKAVLDDPACCKLHPKAPAKDDLVVDASGGVKWTFVYVKKGLEGKTFEPPAQAVQIDQVGCLYTPHVFGVMVGQEIQIRNSDPIMHNTHGLTFGANKEFNRAQIQGQIDRYKMPFPELGYLIKCDVHPWMRSWACVVDNPHHAVSNAEGKFEIKNLPAGKYTLGIWHEGLQTLDGKNEIEVEAKAGQTVNVVMKKK
jgi:hypothetical protein